MAEKELSVLLLARRFEVRGSSSYTLRMAEHLKTESIHAQIITPDARMVDSSKQKRLDISEYVHLDVPVIGRMILELLFRDLVDNIPDLIHIQSRSMLAQGVWLAKKLNRPFVITVHDYLNSRERFKFDHYWGRRIIAVSESVKSELLQCGTLPDELVTVISSGVDVEVESDSPAVLDPEHITVVGTAGPLEAVKGLPFFLRAAQQVLETHENIEFLVSGAGPEEYNLRRLADSLGISRQVTFVPNLLDFSASLRAMDIFCLPSLKQGLGTIMLDAMALGKPVIATGVGGVFSIVRDNHNALLVPPSDSNGLAERIMELLNDPVHARTIGKNARTFVQEQFGVEKMVKQTADLYRDIVATERAESEMAETAS